MALKLIGQLWPRDRVGRPFSTGGLWTLRRAGRSNGRTDFTDLSRSEHVRSGNGRRAPRRAEFGWDCRDGASRGDLSLPRKGAFSGTIVTSSLEAGEVIPFDRAFAIENGPSGFDPRSPKHIPKSAFLMLMRNERLAELETRFDETTRSLAICHNGAVLAQGRLDTEIGKRAIEAFFDEFSADDLRGPAKVVSGPGHSFQDTSTGKVVSLINLQSVRAIANLVAADVHPLRFRANVYVEGLPAWEEFSWVGKRVVAGGVAFEATKRIDRCAAVNVNPLTGARDLSIPKSMMRTVGHLDCGIYLKVVQGGRLCVGEAIATEAG